MLLCCFCETFSCYRKMLKYTDVSWSVFINFTIKRVCLKRALVVKLTLHNLQNVLQLSGKHLQMLTKMVPKPIIARRSKSSYISCASGKKSQMFPVYQRGHLPPFTITALSLDAESPLCLWWMFHHFHLFWPQMLQHFHLFGPHTIFKEKYGLALT